MSLQKEGPHKTNEHNTRFIWANTSKPEVLLPEPPAFAKGLAIALSADVWSGLKRRHEDA